MKQIALSALIALPSVASEIWQADFRDDTGTLRATMTYEVPGGDITLTTLSPWTQPYVSWQPPGGGWLNWFTGYPVAWHVPAEMGPAQGRTETSLRLWQNVGSGIESERYEADFYLIPEPGTYALVGGLGMVAFAAWRRIAG